MQVDLTSQDIFLCCFCRIVPMASLVRSCVKGISSLTSPSWHRRIQQLCFTTAAVTSDASQPFQRNTILRRAPTSFCIDDTPSKRNMSSNDRMGEPVILDFAEFESIRRDGTALLIDVRNPGRPFVLRPMFLQLFGFFYRKR